MPTNFLWACDEQSSMKKDDMFDFEIDPFVHDLHVHKCRDFKNIVKSFYNGADQDMINHPLFGLNLY